MRDEGSQRSKFLCETLSEVKEVIPDKKKRRTNGSPWDMEWWTHPVNHDIWKISKITHSPTWFFLCWRLRDSRLSRSPFVWEVESGITGIRQRTLLTSWEALEEYLLKPFFCYNGIFPLQSQELSLWIPVPLITMGFSFCTNSQPRRKTRWDGWVGEDRGNLLCILQTNWKCIFLP